MAGLNKVILIGNLGSDPEIKYTQGGLAVAKLRLGVSERKKEGLEWKSFTEWFTVVCFGKIAENTGRFLKKGRQIYVDGRFQSKKWETKEGVLRINFEVIANQLIFLGSKNLKLNNQIEEKKIEFSTKSNALKKENNSEMLSSFDDDIPF